MAEFAELQRTLGPAWSANRPGGPPHVLIALPSFSLGESILAHYGERIPALEHRYLLSSLMLPRIESCQLVFVCSVPPAPEMLDYYVSLAPPALRASARSRLRVVAVGERGARSMAEKLLDRPWLLDEIRASFAGRPAFIEPWNVTGHEVEIALRLGAPLNGTSPDLWPLGYKSTGRRLLRAAGVPVPAGQEGVRTVDDVCAAIAAIRRERPDVPGVVVKHDNSGAGDGNQVIVLTGLDGSPLSATEVRARVERLPAWYLADLELGGIVEELVTGSKACSPSVQLDITPYGEVAVLSTHEQVLGGQDNQVYVGCRFPAEPDYAPRLASYGAAVGRLLAERGVVGRLSVDFMAVEEAGRWSLYALEINLRKGGTTHPYSALRNLVPGDYHAASGRWVAADGMPRCYSSTDNLIDPAWRGLPPADVIRAVAAAGLQFDPRTGTGVVLHMLSCLEVDGRLGLIAIGRSRVQARRLYDDTATAIAEQAGRVRVAAV